MVFSSKIYLVNSRTVCASDVSVTTPQGNSAMKAVRSLTTPVAHLLIVIIVCVSLSFAFRNGFTELSATSQHIILCVIGYQLLSAEAIISLAPGWLSSLSLKQRRRVHWALQTLGASLALAGGCLKTVDKNTRKGVNWNTLHGRFGLASMVFTAVSLVNGVTSLYAHELRHILPRNVSKLTHICCGVIALTASSICLSYGYDKESFRTWAATPFTEVMITITCTLTLIVIFNPLITFYNKLSRPVKRNK